MAKCILCPGGYWVCGPNPICDGMEGDTGTSTSTASTAAGGSTTATQPKTKPWKILGTITITTAGKYEIKARKAGDQCEVRIDGPN